MRDRAGRLAAPAVHIGCAAVAFIVSWLIWRETGLPCTIETASILLCNPDAVLSDWIRLDTIRQCALNAGISLAITGGNDGMFFLQERRARQREAARANQAEARANQVQARFDQAEARFDQAEARADQEALARSEATKSTRKWLESLTDEQKDAIYTGPVAIGEFIWVRADGKDTIGPRNNADWLLETLAAPQPE